MRFDEAYSGNVFIKSHPNYDEAKRYLRHANGLDGKLPSRFPFWPYAHSRSVDRLEEYSPYLDRELEDVSYFDAGDIPLPFGNPQRSIDMIEEFVEKLLADGKFPVGMGGEHLVSWPVMKAVS